MKRARVSPILRTRRWSQTQAQGVLEAQERSGLSVSRFAARHGLGAERLYQWRRRLERERKTAASPARFTEVRVALPTAAAIEMVLRDGVTLRFAGATRLEDAVSVLGRLSGR